VFIAVLMSSSVSRLGILQCLINNGAELNSINSKGDTPLMIAVTKSDAAIVKQLIQAGSNLSIASSFHIYYREMKPNTTILALKNNEGFDLLALATANDYLEYIQMLISTGKFDINKTTFSNNTPLHIASEMGHLELCKWLLNHSADVNLANSTGRTALILAIIQRHREVFILLIKSGANIHIIDNLGCNALFYACETGDFELVQELISGGATDVKNMNGTSGLTVAIANNYGDIANIIMKKPVSPLPTTVRASPVIAEEEALISQPFLHKYRRLLWSNLVVKQEIYHSIETQV